MVLSTTILSTRALQLLERRPRSRRRPCKCSNGTDANPNSVLNHDPNPDLNPIPRRQPPRRERGSRWRRSRAEASARAARTRWRWRGWFRYIIAAWALAAWMPKERPWSSGTPHGLRNTISLSLGPREASVAGDRPKARLVLTAPPHSIGLCVPPRPWRGECTLPASPALQTPLLITPLLPPEVAWFGGFAGEEDVAARRAELLT